MLLEWVDLGDQKRRGSTVGGRIDFMARKAKWKEVMGKILESRT